MSFLRGFDSSSSSSTGSGARTTPNHEERRRAIRSGVMASGTLACPDCDAPVAIGADSLSMGQTLYCPFCSHEGRVRDFLSLKTPTRPNRVTIRVQFPTQRP